MNITPDYELLRVLLDRPIAFHRAFVTLSGSVLAGLMLSQAFYWFPRSSTGDGWFYKTQAEWEAETGMGRHEQDTARKRLRQIVTPDGVPVWEEELRGLPAKMHYRVNERALLECLANHPAIKIAGKRQTGTPESGKLDSDEVANLSAGNQQAFYNTENTTDIKAENVRPPSGRMNSKKRRDDPDAPRKYDMSHYPNL